MFIEDVADNQEVAFHKLRYLADLPSEETKESYKGVLDEPIVTLVMSGTREYWNAMMAHLPQIADRTEPLDVPPLDDAKAREFIGRRIAYAQGRIDQFDSDSFDISPFTEEAILVINAAQAGTRATSGCWREGVSRSLQRMLRQSGNPVIDKEIAALVAQAYETILQEVQ